MSRHHFKKTIRRSRQISSRSGISSRPSPKKFGQGLRSSKLISQKTGDLFCEKGSNWKAIFDNSQDGILIADVASKKILKSNKKIRKMLGYSADEICSLFIKDIHPSKDLKRVLNGFELVAKGATSMALHIPMRRKDGSSFYADISSSFVKLSGRKCLVGFFRDISDRKETEEALSESEEVFRTLTERSPNMIFINQGGKVVYANPQCEKVMGYKRKEFYAPQFSFLKLIHPDDVWAVRRNFSIHQKGREVVPYEYKMITKDGKVIYGILTSKLIHYHGALAILGIITDITERKQTEDMIRKTLSLKRATLESTADGILVVGHNTGKVVDFNRRFAQLWSLPVRVLQCRDDKKLLDHVLPQLKDPQSFLSKVAELYRHPKKESFDLLKFKDGRIFERYSHPQLLEGKPVGRVWSFRDVTQRKRAEDALVESERRYRYLFESSQDAMMTLSPSSWRFTSANASMVQMFKAKNVAELLSHSPWELSPKRQPDGHASGEKARQMIQRAVRKGSHFFEWTHRRFDGTTFPVEVLLNKVVTEKGMFLQATVRDITERKKAEELLQQREAYLTSIIENQPGMVWLKDKESRLLAVNQEYVQMTGKKNPKEVVGKTDAEFWPSRMANKFRSDDQAVMKSRRHIMVEELILGKGVAKWHETFKAPVFDQAGKVIGTTGYARDITERKRAEHEILKSKQFNESVIKSLPGAFYVFDIKGKFLRINDRFLKTLGYSRKKALEMHPLDFFPPEERNKVKEKMQEVFEKGESSVEANFLCKSGKKVFFHFTGFRAMMDNGPLLVGMGIDISERKKAEEALKEHRHQLLQVIDAVPHMIFAKDRQGRFLLANRAVAAAYQKEPKDIIGVRRRDIHKKHREVKEFLKGDLEVFASDKPMLFSNESFTDNRGKRHILQTVKIPFQMVGMKDKCVLGVSVDVTEQKRVEEFRNDIVRTVSHELRTPLSIEKEGISLLMDELLGPVTVEQMEILKTVMRSIDRLARMITSLLDISSIETGKIKLSQKMTNLVDIVRGVAFEFKQRALAKGVDLSVKLPRRAVQVFVDPDKMTQVLSNLVDNAIKFTAQGFVRISLNVLKDAIECEVQDTGVGIAPENLAKTFEKFQQFSRTAGPGEKGFGLGLSIVKGIVEMHGGRIWIKSELGKGTCATFSLPLYSKKEV